MLMCVSDIHIRTHTHSAVSLAYHLNAALLIINSLNYLEISNERKCNGRVANIKGEDTEFVLAWMNDSVFEVWRTKISFQLVKTNKLTQKIFVCTLRCDQFVLEGFHFFHWQLFAYSTTYVVVIVNNCPLSIDPVLCFMFEWQYEFHAWMSQLVKYFYTDNCTSKTFTYIFVFKFH